MNATCPWCSGPLPPSKTKPRRFCSPACKEQADTRVRWLRVERGRLVNDLAWRKAAVAMSPDPAGAMRWVASIEARIRKVDDELAILRPDPASSST